MLWLLDEKFYEFQQSKVLELLADITSVTLITFAEKDFAGSVGSFYRYYFCYTYYYCVLTKMLKLPWKDR